MEIKILGIGGAGRNILNALIDSGINPSVTIYIDTDINVLPTSKSEGFIQLGKAVFHGLGTGSRPAYGLIAAQSAEDEIVEATKDCDLVILIAGLGGGVGSGATPYIASLVKSYSSADIIAIVTLAAKWESGGRRRNQAIEAFDLLHKLLGDNLSAIELPYTNLRTLFQEADELVIKRLRYLTEDKLSWS